MLDIGDVIGALRNGNDGRVCLQFTTPSAVRLFDGRWVFGPPAEALEPRGPDIFPTWSFLDYEDTADLALEAEAAARELYEASDSVMGPIHRALSIRQPYAEQIIRGTKRFEFRRKPTNIRERVYIYASAKPADDPSVWREIRMKPGDLPTGVLVGSVEIAACIPHYDNEDEEHAFLLRRPQRLDPPLIPLNRAGQVFWRPQLASVTPARRSVRK